uniref:Uncharacterized protein n=1 Tax=Arundo donax TaxID=35708 RepID=A0A0A9B3K4_ARUDO
MSVEEKDELLKKRREAYHRKKAEAALANVKLQCTCNKENMTPAKSSDCLHRSYMYELQKVPVPNQGPESIMTSTQASNFSIALQGTMNSYQLPSICSFR